VTFTQDVETAAAVEPWRAQRPGRVHDRRLRVGGDVQVLLDRQPALAQVDDIFGPRPEPNDTYD